MKNFTAPRLPPFFLLSNALLRLLDIKRMATFSEVNLYIVQYELFLRG